MCLADGMSFLRPVIFVGRLIGRLMAVKFLNCKRPRAGFEAVELFQPGRKKAVLVIFRRV